MLKCPLLIGICSCLENTSTLYIYYSKINAGYLSWIKNAKLFNILIFDRALRPLLAAAIFILYLSTTGRLISDNHQLKQPYPFHWSAAEKLNQSTCRTGDCQNQIFNSWDCKNSIIFTYIISIYTFQFSL